MGVLPELRAIQTQWLRGEEVEASGLTHEIHSIARALESLVTAEAAVA